MAINEEIVTGRKFRKLVDRSTKLWQRISFWTKASDVEFNDGSTAEDKMGAINGITNSLTVNNGNTALSAAAGKSLQDQINSINNSIISLQNQINTLNNKLGTQVTYAVNGSTLTISPK